MNNQLNNFLLGAQMTLGKAEGSLLHEAEKLPWTEMDSLTGGRGRCKNDGCNITISDPTDPPGCKNKSCTITIL